MKPAPRLPDLSVLLPPDPELAEQIERLHQSFKDVEVRKTFHHGHILRFRPKPLIGWDRNNVLIHTYLPPGFPCATPDNFWAFPELLLPDGLHHRWSMGSVARWCYPTERDVPLDDGYFARSNPFPGLEGYFGTWFRLELQAWNPNHCTAFTWAKVIEGKIRVAPEPEPWWPVWEEA